jgi:Tfp pilus assembly protein PilF
VLGCRILIYLLFALIFAAGCAPPQDTVQQSEMHYTLGLAHMREARLPAALREFIQAAELDPRNPQIQLAMAQSYHRMQAYPEAERHYLEAARLAPGDSAHQNNLGALYLDMRRWDDAIERFRRASQDLLFDQREVALAGLGFAYYQKGEHLAAVGAFQEALARNRLYTPARVYLGDTYLALQKPELALKEYQEAVRLDPNYIPAHFQLGVVRMNQGEHLQAISAFRRVVELAPDSDLGRQAQGYIELLE